MQFLDATTIGMFHYLNDIKWFPWWGLGGFDVQNLNLSLGGFDVQNLNLGLGGFDVQI